MSDEIQVHPVQINTGYGRRGLMPAVVTRKAFEVYDYIHYGTTLTRMNERGGFSTGEIIAFLYARQFPRQEWSKRVTEALVGMDI